jgi:phosphohistidine phosphatase
MAKTLYLMRHAKAASPDMRLGDFNRPLNQRGLQDAPEMGRRLQKRGARPELILCSPAQRTRQTAELLMKEFGGTMGGVQFDDRIYEADPATLLNLIRALPNTCASAMVIGHNPSIGHLAHQFSETGIERMPTCAIATIELSSSSWKDMGKEATRLLDLTTPNTLRKDRLYSSALG